MFSNEDQWLKRQMKRQLSSTLNDSGELGESSDQSSLLVAVTSPAARQQATKQLSLQKTSRSTVRKFHVDNSVVAPDVRKAKKGIRYHLSMLQELHERFIVDQSVECSYSQFTRHVPENIIKPKPEYWGTCLCMVCLNQNSN